MLLFRPRAVRSSNTLAFIEVALTVGHWNATCRVIYILRLGGRSMDVSSPAFGLLTTIAVFTASGLSGPCAEAELDPDVGVPPP